MAGMNQKQLRQQFWADNPQFKKIVSVKVGNGYKRPARQNDYPSDVRLAWCDYVEYANRNGLCSDIVAQHATLQ